MRLLIIVLTLNLYGLAAWSAQANEDSSYRRLKPVPHNTASHTDHKHSTQSNLDHVLPALESSGELNSDQLTSEMVNDIHEISHNHEERTTIKNFTSRWIHQFNLVRHGQDLVRWANARTFTNPALTEHARNLGLLFGASHLLETLSGPVGMMIGQTAGWPESINWAILAAGTMISIPGLDPVCIILAASYKVSPGFRLQVTKLRLSLQRVTSALAQQMRLPQLAARFGHWQTGQQRILTQLEVVNHEMLFKFPGGQIQLRTNNETMWLHQVQIENPDLFRASWMQWFKKFDGNSRRAVREALELKADSQSLPFYIRSIENGTNLKRINFLDGAIQPWGRWQFCNNLLK